MVFAESIRSLTANLTTTAAATMTVLNGMVLLGLFIALGTRVLSWSDHAADKLRTNHEVGNAQGVLDGDLDGFIHEYLLAKAAGKVV